MPTEPGVATIAAPPSCPGPDGHAWFDTRPRPVLLGFAALGLAFTLGILGVHKLELAVAGLVGVALVVAVLLRPAIGGLVLVGAVPVLSGLAPGVPVPHLRASELLVGLVGVTVIATARRADAVPWSGLDWLLLAYGAGWALFGILGVVSLHEHVSLEAWGTTIGQLQFFLLYRAVRLALRSPAERRLATKVLLAAAVPVSLLALLQELHVGLVTRLLNTITGGLAAEVAASIETGNSLRATGPFNNWAALAGYLVPILLVLGALAFGGQLGRRRRAAFVVGLCALLGLLVTIEISAMAMVLVGALVLARQYGMGRRVVRAAALIVVIGALAAAPFIAPRFAAEFSTSAGSSRPAGVPQTLAFRWDVWGGQYLPAIEQRPLTGYGAVLPPSITWVYPESQYVSYLIEGGLPMLALFAALAWAMVGQTRAAATSADPFDRALGRGTLVAVLAMLVMNLIWPFLSNGGMPQVLWCLLALATPRQEPGAHRELLDRPQPFGAFQ